MWPKSQSRGATTDRRGVNVVIDCRLWSQILTTPPSPPATMTVPIVFAPTV